MLSEISQSVDIDMVKEGVMPPWTSVTVGGMLENYGACTAHEWSAFKGTRGEDVVQFSCSIPGPDISMRTREDHVLNQCSVDAGPDCVTQGLATVNRVLSQPVQFVVQFTISKGDFGTFESFDFLVHYLAHRTGFSSR